MTPTSTPEPAAAQAAARPTARDWLSLIRFSHSVFALPFALVALLVATGGRPGVRLLLLVVAAAVLARSAAMAYNRYADRDVDAANPRTARREIPRGVIRPRAALAFALLCGAGFLLVAWALNPVCFAFAVPVLAVLLGYSHAKRFTALSHAWLGLALGLAPIGAWIAATGRLDASLPVPAVLGLAVLSWVAGFDVLYACQDLGFDRAHGLRSLPARIGPGGAMVVARAAHALAVLLFAAFGLWAGLGLAWNIAVAAAAALLWHEHRLLRGQDLSRIDTAFFTMNGLVSLVLLAGALVDLYR